MESFLYYLLRTSILMALFYGLYKVFFSNNTFHNVNRFSLIFMLLMISVLPFFRFNLIPEKKQGPVTETLFMDFSFIPATEFVEIQPHVEIPWMPILIVLFAMGFLFTFIRYLIGLGQIVGVIHKSEKQTIDSHTVLCVTDKTIAPFSWMKYIVLSRKELLTDHQAVISHESAHIHLRHSFDMVFFDIFTCLFWFNPFSWLLRREIQSVHEYQADERVLNDGVDSIQYQLLLIRKSVGEYKFALANNFRQRDLYKRITMMKKIKTDSRMKWNYAMVLPVLFLAMVALSVPKLNASIPEEKSGQMVEKDKVGKEVDEKEVTVPVQTGDSVIISLESVDMNTNPLDPGRTKIVPKDSLRTISGANLAVRGLSLKNDPLIFVDKKRVTSDELKQLNRDDIESVSVLKEKSATAIYGDEGKDGVILIETKKNIKNYDVISVGSGSMDSLRGDVKDIIMKIDKNSLEFRDRATLRIRSGDVGQVFKNPLLIIIDGEKMPKDFELNTIDPNDIESISVLKDKSAIDTYGDEGKDGVIIITRKTQRKELELKGSVDWLTIPERLVKGSKIDINKMVFYSKDENKVITREEYNNMVKRGKVKFVSLNRLQVTPDDADEMTTSLWKNYPDAEGFFLVHSNK